MEENKKYFTPTAKDFYIGAEYEILYREKDWTPFKCGSREEVVRMQQIVLGKEYEVRMKYPWNLKSKEETLKAGKFEWDLSQPKDPNHGRISYPPEWDKEKVLGTMKERGIVPKTPVELVEEKFNENTTNMEKLKAYRDLYHVLWIKIEALLAKENINLRE